MTTRRYLAKLESGRDFMFTAEDDIDAMFAADEEAKLFDDYLVDVIPILDYAQKETLFS